MRAAVGLFIALAAGYFLLALYGKYQMIKAEFREEQARDLDERRKDLRDDPVNDGPDGLVP